MAFVKVVKNKAYFKRYQVKYRRRREGKTDYQARRRLVLQDKNKYNTHKYRFVVRITNKKIICQVIYSTITGDRILCNADSTELIHFGLPNIGLTNYASAYCTGLLLSRRLLKQLKLDDQFRGIEEATGEEYHVEENFEERRPFKCYLDVGIVKTTTGNRVFGAMKGACDGGIHIPHSNKRFPGYTVDETTKESSYNADSHRERIYGIHISKYMSEMKEENSEKYEAHFAHYIKAGVQADKIEEIYKTIHKKIRANPDKAPKKKRAHDPVHIREGAFIKTSKGSYPRYKKLSLEQRKARVAKKMALVAEKMQES